jgi:hypothetical protein
LGPAPCGQSLARWPSFDSEAGIVAASPAEQDR